MHLAYVDESGNTGGNLQDPEQPIYVAGGLIIHAQKWRACDQEMRAIIRDAANRICAHTPAILERDANARRIWAKYIFPGMSKSQRAGLEAAEIISGLEEYLLKSGNFELHASPLCSGHGHFIGIDRGHRGAIIDGVLKVLERSECKFIAAVVHKERLWKRYSAPERPDRLGLMVLTEEFERFLKEQSSWGILISDKVTNVDEHRRHVSEFQQRGTPYAPGIPITRVIDAIHFVESHATPLIQAADVATQLLYQNLRGVPHWARQYGMLKQSLERKVNRFN